MCSTCARLFPHLVSAQLLLQPLPRPFVRLDDGLLTVTQLPRILLRRQLALHEGSAVSVASNLRLTQRREYLHTGDGTKQRGEERRTK